MARRFGKLFCTIVFGAIAMSVGAHAQFPRDNESKLTGAARITGRVVAADDGAPVRRAKVQLSGHPDAEPDHVRLSRQVETDAGGRFAFAALPAGRYAVFTEQALRGFVTLARYREATLTAQQTVDMTIRLQRAGAIEGRILDENGDGMLGAEVVAVGRVDVAGHGAVADPRANARTDDRGHYRIFNIPAGEYYVVAEAPVEHGSHAPPPPSYGYPMTYYPGTPTRRDARAVVVRAGLDTQRVDFALPRRRLANLTIQGVDSRGARLGSDARASLNRRDDISMLSSSRTAMMRDDGTFIIDAIKPGDYNLIVSTGVGMGEAVVVMVSIGEADQSLSVRTNAGARVSGRVIVDGRPAEGAPGLSAIWVRATAAPRSFGYPYLRTTPESQLKGTDRFELVGLRGPMVLSSDGYLKGLMSIRRGNEDLAGKTIEFTGTEVFDDVVVELTTRLATLDVNIEGVSPADETESVMVMMFPEDSTQWRFPFVTQWSANLLARPADPAISSPYRMEFPRRVPGRYLVVALYSRGFQDPSAPALLEALRPLATPVTLVAGQTAAITLPITNVPALK